MSASSAALARDSALVSLGEHRFEDLAASERVFQLGPGEFPPLNSLGRTNLPVPATPFLGRSSELAAVTELAGRADVRIVTLTGPGGTGKTRLAVQAAAELGDRHPDGTRWVPLAALRDPALMLSAVAAALDVRERAVLAALDGRRELLLLDNVEHLLPHAATLIGQLVSVPGPTVLVTSRERLRLQAEHVYTVPALSEPDAEELFVARARQLDAGFRATPAVAELCRRLDDLPLGLELAAARTPLFSTDQLLERLGDRLDLLQGGRDVDPRQQTLRATIEWSHDLLDEAEQRLFARLTVFATGCTFEAAEAVCDADPETLQALVDKSFLRRRETAVGPRFWMLGTIRDYGAERLAASEEEETVRERHADWCLSLVAQAPDHSVGPDFERARSILVEERGEIAGVMAWARSTGRDELALRLGSPLDQFWLSLFLPEARAWLEHAERVIPSASGELRAPALRACAAIAFFVLADTPRAVGLWQRALEEAVDAGDERLAATVRYRLALAAWEQGDRGTAVGFLERALADARERGDGLLEIQALHHLGEVLRDLREFARAEALMTESVALSKAIGDLQMADQTTHSLGDLNLDRGGFDEAAGYYATSLRFVHANDDRRGAAYAIAGIACVSLGRGDVSAAAKLWAAAEAAETEYGFRMLGAERARYARLLDPLKGTPAWPPGPPLPLGDAVEVALENEHPHPVDSAP